MGEEFEDLMALQKSLNRLAELNMVIKNFILDLNKLSDPRIQELFRKYEIEIKDN